MGSSRALNHSAQCCPNYPGNPGANAYNQGLDLKTNASRANLSGDVLSQLSNEREDQ